MIPSREEFIALCKEHGACPTEFNKLIHAKSDAKFWGVALANYSWCMDEEILILDDIISLIRNGADINAENNHGDTPLMIASQRGNLEIVKELLSYGVDVNVRDNDRNTALQYALDYDYPEVAQLLKQHGAV